MQIYKLEAENFLNLKFIQINPGPNGVILSGKNAAGKSATMDAVEYALCGPRKKPLSEPIRSGEEKAYVIVQTEKWTAKRVITKKAERLEVVS